MHFLTAGGHSTFFSTYFLRPDCTTLGHCLPAGTSLDGSGEAEAAWGSQCDHTVSKEDNSKRVSLLPPYTPVLTRDLIPPQPSQESQPPPAPAPGHAATARRLNLRAPSLDQARLAPSRSALNFGKDPPPGKAGGSPARRRFGSFPPRRGQPRGSKLSIPLSPTAPAPRPPHLRTSRRPAHAPPASRLPTQRGPQQRCRAGAASPPTPRRGRAVPAGGAVPRDRREGR